MSLMPSNRQEQAERHGDAGSPQEKMEPATIFLPGANCFHAVQTSRAAFLVDAQDYFSAFMRAAQRATRSIIILAWDFDSRTPLQYSGGQAKASGALGVFLNDLVKHKPDLDVYILDWDYPMIFGTDREFPPLYGLSWTPRRRIHFHYDNTHPVGGSHHQKIVVMDDAIAFAGGLDLASKRWDTCEHCADDPRRIVNGTAYPPFHDVMAAVDGEAAKIMAGIARDRWLRATGRTIPRVLTDSDPWPPDLKVDMSNVTVGISRTVPATTAAPGIREIEQLYLDMIARAKRYIYVENQYLTSNTIGDALAARMLERDGPEIVIVLRLLSHGWLEENTMHALRTRLIKQLQVADQWKRLAVYYPHVPGLKDGECVDIHSKVMAVDDEWLRIGSANLCNRSMGMDTECDLTFEARGAEPLNVLIRDFRNRLLAEHLAVSPAEVQDQYERSGSLVKTIAGLQGQERTLKPLEEPEDWPDFVIDMATIADPERPVSMERLMKEFAPDMTAEKTGPSWRILIILACVFGGFAAIWRFTPLSEWATPERVMAIAHDFSGRSWAAFFIIAAYTPACIILFPRPLITLFAVVAFGAWLGFAYAMAGILIAALATYLAGRMLDRATVRKLAGKKLNRVSELFRRHGLPAVIALRLVPVAPFVVEGLVAGAIRIKLWHFLVGTAVGMLPGTLATTVFGDQIEAALLDPDRINYWLVAGAVAILIIIVLIVRHWLLKAGSKSAD